MRILRISCAIYFFAALTLNAQVADNETKTPESWTFLVYMTADNDLEARAFEDIREMESVGSNPQLNIVVQLDARRKSGASRFLVQKNPKSFNKGAKEFQLGSDYFYSPILESFKEPDMASPVVLEEFISWGMKEFPADRYAIIFWGHGSGWNKSAQSKAIAFDDSESSSLSVQSLRDVLDRLSRSREKKFDVVLFDSCLMGMVEVADALSTSVDWMVASQDKIPGDGMPYDEFLSVWEGLEHKSSENFSRQAVAAFNMSYTEGSQGHQAVSMSGIRLSAIEPLRETLNDWLRLVEQNSALRTFDLEEAAHSATPFDNPEYRDLGSYISHVLNKYRERVGQNEVTDPFVVQTEALLVRIKWAAVFHQKNASRYAETLGLSVYLPAGYYNRSSWASIFSGKKIAYLKTGWAQRSIWPKHLDYLFPLALH